MRNKLLITCLFLVFSSAGCNFRSARELFVQETPKVMGDAFFFGYAYVDANGNQELDADDTPLSNARFQAGGFGALTDAFGIATITIPGGWSQPLAAHMAPPEGSSFTLIGPTEVILLQNETVRAEFLFSPSSGISTPLPPAEPTATITPSQTTFDTSKLGTIEKDLTYCVVENGVSLLMDITYPLEMEEPAPVAVYVHGGGWVSGDKSGGAGARFLPLLHERGYLVVSINYRLSPEYQFPAHIEDVKCAIRHLRANASSYNLDPDRIGVIGGSAGGHLVSLLGTSDESSGWEVGEYLDVSSRVQAVVDMFGPTDLTILPKDRPEVRTNVFGAASIDDPLLITFSPLTYITADDPPFLILQGDQDPVVPLAHSQLLYEGLTSAGVPAQLVVVKNAGHGFRPVTGRISPSMEELQKIVADFFDKHLVEPFNTSFLLFGINW